MVRTSYERSGRDMAKTHGERFFPELAEFVRAIVLFHRKRSLVRLKILADGQYIATDLPEVVHGQPYFIKLFSQTEHESRLGHRAVRLSPAEQSEGTVVIRLRPYPGIECGHGLEVVVQHVRTCIEHGPKRSVGTLKVRDKDFHAA